MASTTFRGYAYNPGGWDGYYYDVVVNWSYNKANKQITVNSISPTITPSGWCVGSSMRFAIYWSDGYEEVISDGTYNWNAATQSVKYTWSNSSARGAGFITFRDAVGIFTEVQGRLPRTHTFGGTSGGFTPRFGSTRGTLNGGNPQAYGNMSKINGDDTGGIVFNTPPNINNAGHSLTNPSVWKITDTISNIDWGVGATSKTLTAVVSYTFNGQNYSYTAYSSNNPGNSASFTINAYNDASPWLKVPAGTNVKVKWTATTNNGSSTNEKTVYCKAPDGPSIANAVTSSNPSVYRLKSAASGISYGDYYKSTTCTAIVSYTLDGTNYSYTAYSNTSQPTAPSFDEQGLVTAPNAPWTRVPDDESVTITWTATCNVGYTTLSATKQVTQACMPSYDAFVIESGVNGGAPVKADLLVSNTVGSQPNKAIRRITTIESS